MKRQQTRQVDTEFLAWFATLSVAEQELTLSELELLFQELGVDEPPPIARVKALVRQTHCDMIAAELLRDVKVHF
jgi:hypothetical protein